MRKSCLNCARKHVAQASVLNDEAFLGYPSHIWLAIGHLAEAESECVKDHPGLAAEIRESRLGLIADEGFDVDYLGLIERLSHESSSKRDDSGGVNLPSRSSTSGEG